MTTFAWKISPENGLWVSYRKLCIYWEYFFLLPNSLCCICGGYTAISPESLFLITQRLIWFEIHVYSFFYPPNCKMYTLKVFLMGKKMLKCIGVGCDGLGRSVTFSNLTSIFIQVHYNQLRQFSFGWLGKFPIVSSFLGGRMP